MVRHKVALGVVCLGVVLMILIALVSLSSNSQLSELGGRKSHEPTSVAKVLTQTSAMEMPERDSGQGMQAISEDAVAKVQFFESQRSWQRRLPISELRELSDQGDMIAMELLAGELAESSPDEALGYALIAAKSGRPAAAMLAADILARQKHEQAEGLLLLDSFEDKHGRSPLLTTYRRKYAAIYAVTEQQILSSYRLLKSNKERGAPQKYSLTTTSRTMAPAPPAPP